ncbi:ferredoxin [Streptomyces sp. NBC_01387]|uniref:ferredoxin n=1 Tax=unclassified Streptomyces TaxID=2593676 RepID=UPI002025A46D|nr:MULTISPECIES: ferredoxin [unclassified Streptomyces]MCX4552829.1 ferredoxin [Streptomyces sp. NBC_01500]WSC24160.1 ferredoxin [Streptomyces sp. NBC_01766]WSV58047.1 ferredoxin [Streptomyces sp. NBC_01014]
MRPVACLRCEATVLVRKSSWHQTSIQWDGAAMSACAERPAAATDAGRLETCRSLRDSVRQAALTGAIEVPDPRTEDAAENDADDQADGERSTP